MNVNGSEVINAAITAKNAYYRDHFRHPKRFRLSPEGDEAMRDEVRRRVAQRGVQISARGSLTLYGVDVEVSDDLTGAEVEAV